MRCTLCGGLLALLGKLGAWTWFRCQDCGMEFSKHDHDLDLEDATDDL